MDVLKEIDYWIEQADQDLHCFNENGKEQARQMMTHLYNIGELRWHFLEDKKGIIVYVIVPDFRGGTCVNEAFMYIKPEHRGKIRLFKELVEHLEEVAKKENHASVRIASNIGYNDAVVLKCLQRFGYATDVVVKYMR